MRRFKEQIEPMGLSLEFWLTLLDNLEREVISLCEKQGIPSEEIVNYLAYAKKQFKWIDRFSQLTLWNEILNRIQQFLIRGLKESKMVEILDILFWLKKEADFYREHGYWYKEVYIKDVKLISMFLKQSAYIPAVKKFEFLLSQTYLFTDVKKLVESVTQTYLFSNVKIISNAISQTVRIE
jgi:hypothetical protein